MSVRDYFDYFSYMQMVLKYVINKHSRRVHFRISKSIFRIACKSLFLTNTGRKQDFRWKYSKISMKWMNQGTCAILFVNIKNDLSLKMKGCFKGYLLTVYTVSYILHLSQWDCRKFVCSIVIISPLSVKKCGIIFIFTCLKWHYAPLRINGMWKFDI